MSIPYCRGVLVKADDPQMIYLGNGVSAFGGLGALHARATGGRPGRPQPVPMPPNGTIWNLATHVADPDFLLASSVNGQVFMAPMPAIPGASFPGNSARSTPSPGCRTRHNDFRWVG